MVKIGDGAVSWKSKKQSCVALSSTEAEYIWMVDFLRNLGVSLRGSMVVNVNNQRSISLAKNPVFYDRSKHIGIYIISRVIYDLVKGQRIHLEYIPTKNMLADLLHEALPRTQHEQLSEGIGLS